MYKAAIDATAAVDYQGAGTIEFIVEDENFFFMEMNTRLQVEHRVTEMVTGTDLVEWQILVAAGKQLPLNQEDIQCNGHAIQARIYAEDSFNGFLPATGLLEEVKFCIGDDIIIDTGIEKNNNISIHFDPMIAKTVCWAKDRQACINKVLHNLDHTFIVGVKTNLGFLSGLISKIEFSDNTIFTNSLDNESLKVELPQINDEILASLIANTSTNKATSAWKGNLGWSNSGSYSNHYKWTYNDEDITVSALIQDNAVLINDHLIELETDSIVFESASQIQLINNHQRYIFDKINHQSAALAQNKGDIVSPMPGKVLDIKVQVGDKVLADQTLVVMEAMKMELALKATVDTTVVEILVAQDDVITANSLMIKLDS